MESIDNCIKDLLKNKDLRNPDSFEDLGYLFFGPLVFNFFAWLKSEVIDCDLILFNSREGYFLQQIYHMFEEKYDLPKSEYFKTSRKLSSIPSFFNSEDIYNSFKSHRYSGKLSNLLSDRFGINPIIKNDIEIDTKIAIPNLDEFIFEILENSKRVRNEYGVYIKSIIKDKFNIIMIDSGFQGTTQYNIEKTYQIQMKGRYFNYKGNVNLKDVKGFYDFHNTNFAKNIIFFESIFVDKIGSYIDIIDNCFVNENLEVNNYFEQKIQIVSGIKKFIHNMFSYDFDFKSVSYKYADEIFDLMCKKDYVKNNSLFDIFFHDNYYVRDNTKKVVRQ